MAAKLIDVFNNCKCVREEQHLAAGEVRSLAFGDNRSVMVVELGLHEVVRRDAMAKVEKQLARQYGLDRVCIEPRYEMEGELSREYICSLYDDMAARMPSARGLLHSDNWEFADGALHIPMDSICEKHFETALRHLEACGADCIIMPCNTAHYFLPQLQSETEIPFISMLASTAKACAQRYAGKCAAVLATKGTLATGLYARALEAEGAAYLIPDAAEQDMLMHIIYDVVKASKPLAPETENWTRLLADMRARGADYFILGCTELPIAAQQIGAEGPFVDPTEELARAAIRFCGYGVKGE